MSVKENTSNLFHPASAADYLPHTQLRQLQTQRLREIVKIAFDHQELTRSRMEASKVTPESIESLEDIAKLPFTVKADLRDTYPFGLFTRPINEIVRVHASSGTTGKPIVVAYTQQDIDVWTESVVRCLAACGCHRGDIIQNAYGYGLFTGGLGIHYGAEALGATVIPISGGNTARQLMVLKDFNVTAICCTPSYFLHLLEKAQSMGIDIRTLPLKAGVFGAEPWTNEMRKRIEEISGIKAYDIYGLSEIVGPGVGVECCCQNGPHILEDHYYPEIVDPKTGNPLPDGQEGELVLTTLSKKAMPMIRYRTRDITRIIAEPCPCGRTIRQIQRISRRSDDMFIIRGVNVFPSQIETAILSVEGTLPHYQIVLSRKGGLDQIEVQVEVTKEFFSDRIRELEKLQDKLTGSVENIIGVRVKISLVEPESIQRSEGKAKRIIDNRQL